MNMMELLPLKVYLPIPLNWTEKSIFAPVCFSAYICFQQTEPAEEPAAILAKILERLRYLQQAKAELSAQIQSGEESPGDRELLKATLQAVIAERNQLLAGSRKSKAEQEGKEGKPTPKGIGTPGKRNPQRRQQLKQGKEKNQRHKRRQKKQWKLRPVIRGSPIQRQDWR